jgi:MYXO-CTERM domain-containing protein
MSRCLDALGYQVRTTYQPGNRFWAFQWIESAVFVGLAALLVVAALVALRRRDG